MQPALARPLEGARILVAEDSALQALDLKHLLENAGAEVIGPAKTVADVLALARLAPTCAVLDVLLCKEHVFKAARVLAWRGVPIVFYTGSGDLKAIKREWPKAQVISKPAPFRLLLEAVKLRQQQVHGAQPRKSGASRREAGANGRFVSSSIRPEIMTRVLIIDSHPLVRAEIARAVQQAVPQTAILEAGSAVAALGLAEQHSRLDLVILEPLLPGASRFEALKAVREYLPGVSVLVFSALDDGKAAADALSLGALSFVPKSASLASFVEAVKTVCQGSHFPAQPASSKP